MKRFINLGMFLFSKKMDKKNILEQTAKEYFNSGEDELKKERYNSALVLFFKTLIALTDLYIFQNTNEAPSSHRDRFYIAQTKFPEVYDLLDKDFPFYRDSYIYTIDIEYCPIHGKKLIIEDE